MPDQVGDPGSVAAEKPKHAQTITEHFRLQVEECSLQWGQGRNFPFKRVLSLRPLVEFWRETMMCGEGQIRSACVERVRQELDLASDLLEPIPEGVIPEQREELVRALMGVVFAPASWETELAAAMPPFTFRSFLRTPSYARWVPNDGVLPEANVDDQTMGYLMVLHAYSAILKEFYGVTLDVDYPIIRRTRNPDTGLPAYFQVMVERQFNRVVAVGEVRPLTASERERVLANLTQLNVLMELMPPERFEFHGFVVVRVVDVTDQEVLSRIKRDLLESTSVVSRERFESLQDNLRTLLQRPAIRLNVAVLNGPEVLMIRPPCEIESNCIYQDSAHMDRSELKGTIYESALRHGEPLVIDDLADPDQRARFEKDSFCSETRNVVVAPLEYGRKVTGALMLSSPNPGDLNMINSLKLREVLPLFAVAIQRSMDELNGRVQAIIQEKCTAIHPSVEWRFRQAATRFIRGSGEKHADIEPIVFRNVYPLYGASDIRSSSSLRTSAIQQDLTEHLGMARDILVLAQGQRPMPILDQLVHRIERNLSDLRGNLLAEDETRIFEFLRHEVESYFDGLSGLGAVVAERIATYRAQLDSELHTVYRRRRDFDNSVTLLNDKLSQVIEREQPSAQAMFPHYFEKQTTDGIEHSIYIGEAMAENGRFDLLFLRNLRLWQLLVTCSMVREAERIKRRLPIPLEIANLIVVQHNPITIRFRYDEKQFYKEGSYNIRYEIMKKRIDKARIKGSVERLTQPGRIAVVYSQPAEGAEYQSYIEYLRSAGHLTGEAEELEVEDLHGIQGLKALRVHVEQRTGSESHTADPLTKEMSRVISMGA